MMRKDQENGIGLENGDSSIQWEYVQGRKKYVQRRENITIKGLSMSREAIICLQNKKVQLDTRKQCLENNKVDLEQVEQV